MMNTDRSSLCTIQIIPWIILLMLMVNPDTASAEEYSLIAAGLFDDHAATSSAIMFEVRNDTRFIGPIQPGVAIITTSRQAIWLGLTMSTAIAVGRLVVVTPFLGAGWYDRGRDKDLGHNLQFREGIELSIRLREKWRVGILYNHLSNMRLGDRNPGAEGYLLFLTRVFPADRHRFPD